MLLSLLHIIGQLLRLVAYCTIFLLLSVILLGGVCALSGCQHITVHAQPPNTCVRVEANQSIWKSQAGTRSSDIGAVTDLKADATIPLTP
jgi:uncharacterized metal-binding protein